MHPRTPLASAPNRSGWAALPEKKRPEAKAALQGQPPQPGGVPAEQGGGGEAGEPHAPQTRSAPGGGGAEAGPSVPPTPGEPRSQPETPPPPPPSPPPLPLARLLGLRRRLPQALLPRPEPAPTQTGRRDSQDAGRLQLHGRASAEAAERQPQPSHRSAAAGQALLVGQAVTEPAELGLGRGDVEALSQQRGKGPGDRCDQQLPDRHHQGKQHLSRLFQG